MSCRAMFGIVLAFALVAITGLGCDSSTSTETGGASMEELAGAIDAQKASQQKQEQARSDAERQAQETQQAAASATEQQPAEQDRQVAGRARVGEGGYYTAIVGARRHILNKVESLAWIQGVQHFQATNGRLPKDHAEFMNQIVKPLEIDLGYKEENQEFLYDPSEGQFGTLYVVEKAEEPAQP